jgi:hypothetical protein
MTRMFFRTLSPRTINTALAASHFMVWISSVIVVGITGYFLKNFVHGQHLIYEMVISALVLAFWLPSFVLPLTKTYKSYYLPMNIIFSYLYAKHISISSFEAQLADLR